MIFPKADHAPESATLVDMIADLNAQGIFLWREGSDIHYRARRGKLTPAMLADLRVSKACLLPLLGISPPTAFTTTPNIVLLDRGDSHRSVFCVHALDGGVAAYMELAHELASAGISTYGVQALDLDGCTPLQGTFAAIAARYVQQIRRILGDAPLHLVGWCMGSLIAFEMARCLSELGAEVGEVVLLDPPVSFRGSPPLDPKRLDNNLRSLLPPHDEPNACEWWKLLTLVTAYIDSSESYPLSPRFWMMDDAGKSEYLFSNLRNPLLISPNSMLADARCAGDVLYMFNIVRQQYAALRVYQPSHFDGKLTLFVSGDSSEQCDFRMEAACRAWRRLCGGIAHAQGVLGDHMNMLQDPRVGHIARRIEQST